MFDIREYYGDVHDGGSVPMEQCPAEIEEDISTDIDKLLRSSFDSLYARDRFRNGQASVEILHPRHPYQGNRTLLKGPDHMRYLLSLYPRKSDLDNLKMLVLRPRHIEAGDTELMALYLRRGGILVFYLHHPCLFTVGNSSFGEYSEFLSFEIAETFLNGAPPPWCGPKATSASRPSGTRCPLSAVRTMIVSINSSSGATARRTPRSPVR